MHSRKCNPPRKVGCTLEGATHHRRWEAPREIVMEEEVFEDDETNTPLSGRTVTRILQQVVPYWKLVIFFLSLVVLITISDSIFTYFGKLLVDDAIIPRDPVALRAILTNFAILSIISAGIVFGFIFITGLLGEKVRYDLRRKLFHHLQELTFSYFDKTAVGWIMSRVTSDTERIADLVTWGLLDVVWGITSVLVATGFMLFINWRLALLVMITIPLLVGVAYYFRRLILTQFREVRRINSKITGAYNENITGVRVTKSLAREDKDLTEFQKLTGMMFNASYRANVLSAMFLPAVQFISALGVAAVIFYGGLLALRGETTVGQIQAFIGYVTFMIWPVQEMARVFAQMQQSIASGERVFSLLDAVPEVMDKPGALETAHLEGDILFDDVTFYYEKDKPVLRNFNLRVRPGDTIALVGPTGGGKSTIVNLLCRFYEPKDGRILFGEHDYTDLTQHAIQSRIGMVLQTPHLFSGTIRENLRYGRLDATDDDLVEADDAGARRRRESSCEVGRWTRIEVLISSPSLILHGRWGHLAGHVANAAKGGDITHRAGLLYIAKRAFCMPCPGISIPERSLGAVPPAADRIIDKQGADVIPPDSNLRDRPTSLNCTKIRRDIHRSNFIGITIP